MNCYFVNVLIFFYYYYQIIITTSTPLLGQCGVTAFSVVYNKIHPADNNVILLRNRIHVQPREVGTWYHFHAKFIPSA